MVLDKNQGSLTIRVVQPGGFPAVRSVFSFLLQYWLQDINLSIQDISEEEPSSQIMSIPPLLGSSAGGFGSARGDSSVEDNPVR
jgi:hypothetical protein